MGEEKMTRKQMRSELGTFETQVFNRLEGRDIQEAVEELLGKAEDVIMDELGMPYGMDNQNEDHQMMFYDIVAKQLIKAYFTPKDEAAPTIEDI